MSNLLTAESPIIILPSLATEFGLPEAALLQQIHYTAMQKEKGLTHQGHKWIYNTLDQWHAKFSCWSMATIERAITKLRKLGIIHIQRLGHHKSIRTNYYRIDYPKLAHIPQLADPAPCGKDSRKTQTSTGGHRQKRHCTASPAQSAAHPLARRTAYRTAVAQRRHHSVPLELLHRSCAPRSGSPCLSFRSC